MTQWLDADGDPLPDGVVLKPARLQWLIILLLTLGFVAIAVFLGQDMDPLTRWASGGFFGVCGMIALAQVISGITRGGWASNTDYPFLGVGARLVLDREGFTCSTLFTTFRRLWVDCSEFAPVRIGVNMMVGFSTAKDEADHPRLAAVARGLTGTSGALPDTYGVAADELADLMNRFRARALGS